MARGWLPTIFFAASLALAVSSSPARASMPFNPVLDVFVSSPAASANSNLRLATSLISVDQAKQNLDLEIAGTDTFDTVKDRAQRLWDNQLRVVEVEGPQVCDFDAFNLHDPREWFYSAGTRTRIHFAPPRSHSL